ncbi:MAG: hypothetical protein BJ554DRAFT_7631 [Olpidium bornovanus]|uniref:Uncharacterized protein n=1 Tax=Olpidium bornovanus TaxID=278681 RepID=A0A8H7ZW37_9FUNG|nr:MAG: hypothetical protein BJ554DRAFT_7631 [Olpidium bornovanus]
MRWKNPTPALAAAALILLVAQLAAWGGTPAAGQAASNSTAAAAANRTANGTAPTANGTAPTANGTAQVVEGQPWTGPDPRLGPHFPAPSPTNPGARKVPLDLGRVVCAVLGGTIYGLIG